jgi:predicted  nucleic acid-binding Zn-ribbon protein
MDKLSKHLKDVEHEINKLEKGFCMHLCCSSKRKKRKSKTFLRDKSEENLIDLEYESSDSNDQLKNLDANLRKLQDFNELIDKEIQDQIQTLVCFLKKELNKKQKSCFSYFRIIVIAKLI